MWIRGYFWHTSYIPLSEWTGSVWSYLCTNLNSRIELGSTKIATVYYIIRIGETNGNDMCASLLWYHRAKLRHYKGRQVKEEDENLCTNLLWTDGRKFTLIRS